jgi:acetate---CoA ligase (ADP-forming)
MTEPEDGMGADVTGAGRSRARELALRSGAMRMLLRPQSVALLGVSRPAPGKSRVGGAAVLANLRRGGFTGAITVVHPSADIIDDVACIRAIADAPGPVDLAVISLPAKSVPEAVRDCAEAGIRAFVILTAGFGETGTAEGRVLEGELRRLGQKYDLAICGPNGLGLLNVPEQVYTANFAPIETLRPNAGGLAIISQSGAIGGSLLARAVQRRIGISHVISTGNETVTTMADYVEALADDDRVRAFSVYMEGADDPRRLIAAFSRARAAGKPVVVYKVGESEVGARAALSHTAKLAGEPRLYRGAFEQAGVVQAESLPDLIDAQMYFLSETDLAQAPAGVCVVSISGGLGAVTADELARAGIDVPPLSPATRKELDGLGLDLGATGNPVDTAGATQRREDVLTTLLTIIGRDPAIDAIVVPLASRFPVAAQTTPKDLLAARAAAGIPVLAAWYTGDDNADAVAALRADGRVACFDDAGGCARAIRWARRLAQLPADQAEIPALAVPLFQHQDGVLDEPASKALLAECGLRFPRETIVTSAAEASQAATEIGFPVAMKVISADIAHKAAVGGVSLAINDQVAAAGAYRAILTAVASAAPGAVVTGVLISEMVNVAQEFLVGVYNDASFGPTLAFGRGGSQVEQLADVSLRLLPATRREIESMVRDRLRDLLPEQITRAVIDSVANVAAFAAGAGRRLSELDVNPLVVTADERVLTLDAVISLSES